MYRFAQKEKEYKAKLIKQAKNFCTIIAIDMIFDIFHTLFTCCFNKQQSPYH